MRGEDLRRRPSWTFPAETPPRAWGRLTYTLQPLFGGGNTPTCVGKTNDGLEGLQLDQKHPHVRGEDLKMAEHTKREVETPPRAWGRRFGQLSAMHQSRNTPTCVGKTASRVNRNVPRWKHPHVRGEDTLSPLVSYWLAETPPRAWGRLTLQGSRTNEERNTPTCVGKTFRLARKNTWSWKHPHVRGEDTDRRGWSRPPSETPPRAWGRRMPEQTSRDAVRNTPTCVGKTRLGVEHGE